MTASTLERRNIATELRVSRQPGKASRATGLAVVFDAKSENLGGFREIIKAGALDLDGDVVANVEHDHRSILGRTKYDTLALKENRQGLGFDLELPDTQLGQDVATKIARGDLDGMSFEFRVNPGGDHWTETEAGVVREVRSAKLEAITLTAFPAYPDASVALRSLAGWKESRSTDEDRRRRLRLAAASLRV